MRLDCKPDAVTAAHDASAPRPDLVAEYAARTPRSAAMHARMCRSLPGGETRAVTFHEPYPLAVAEADRGWITDLDGNQYLDLLNNMGALIHGHRYPPVLAAIAGAAATVGTAPAMAHDHLAAYAELLVERFPGIEALRLTNSGTEAALLALRLARRATGRTSFLQLDRGYHGMAAELNEPSPARVVVPYNDLDAVDRALDGSIAAVLVEPFLGHGGVIPAEPGFLEGIGRLTRERGAVYVLDEVQSVRNDLRGQHGALGLDPDLVMLGKAVGGGLPIGVLGGRRDLLELASGSHPDGLRHSGTFNGNALSCAAGHAAMQALDRPRIDRLNARAARLTAALQAEGRRLGLPLTVRCSGSTMRLEFCDDGGRGAGAAPELARSIQLGALLEGICLIPGGRLNLSTVLTEEDLRTAERGLGRALDRLASPG